MLQRGGKFRLFVTLLLAVAVPFCCCNFHSWLSVCVPCEAAAHPTADEQVTHHHADGAAHDHESDHHDLATTSTDAGEPNPSPCGRPGHDDDHDCTCGKQSTLLTVAKPTLEFPTPILVAILSFPTITESGALSQFRTVGRDLWVGCRPPTTLLHLHCALIL